MTGAHAGFCDLQMAEADACVCVGRGGGGGGGGEGGRGVVRCDREMDLVLCAVSVTGGVPWCVVRREGGLQGVSVASPASVP